MAVTKEPQNLDAEISVLGCAFISNDGLSKVVEELHEDIFYSEANKKIFSVIKDLHTKNIAIDSTTVTNELEKRKELSIVGGIEYISDIISSVATTTSNDNSIFSIFSLVSNASFFIFSLGLILWVGGMLKIIVQVMLGNHQEKNVSKKYMK